VNGRVATKTVILVLALFAVHLAGIADLVGGGRAPLGTTLQLLPPLWTLDREAGDPAADRELQSEIEDYLADLQGTYGIAIQNLDDGRIVRVNADAELEAASMYKLLVMYRVFHRIELGDLRLDDIITIQEPDTRESVAAHDLAPGESVTVEEALESMISLSSNSAAYALSRTVGGWGAIDGAAREIGMIHTHWDDGYWSTPDDMMRLFEALADRRLVSRDASNRMVELLLEQNINDRIPALLPQGVRVAHKTGELDNVRNDGGIVSTPRGRYIIIVMSYDVDPAEATEAIAEISRLVYERYG
jgi:beta-lactamase class A